jgi:hypothetical protein
MKTRSLVAMSLGLSLALSGVAFAGGQQIAVEVAKDGKSLLVHTYRCGTPSEFTVVGTAEGMVNGQTRSVPLRLTRTAEPSVFAVERQWPSEGRWVLTFRTEGAVFVNALVELQPGATLRVASQESTYKKITPGQIAAALDRLSRS